MVMLLTVSRELSYILVQNTKAILKTISQLAQPILLQFPCWGPSGGFFEDETLHSMNMHSMPDVLQQIPGIQSKGWPQVCLKYKSKLPNCVWRAHQAVLINCFPLQLHPYLPVLCRCRPRQHIHKVPSVRQPCGLQSYCKQRG